MTATIARRGFTTWRLTIDANGGHSSAIFTPAIGSGAIYEGARFVSELHEQLRGEPNLTINPSVVLSCDSHPPADTGLILVAAPSHLRLHCPDARSP